MSLLFENIALSARTPFVPITILFVLGIIADHLFKIPLGWILALIALVLIVFLAQRFKRSPTIVKPEIVLLAVILLMGMIRFSIWRESYLGQPYREHLPLQVDTLWANITQVQNSRGVKAIAELEKIKRDSLSVNLSGKLQIYFPYQFSSTIAPGDTLAIYNARLAQLPEPRNPGQFDYGEYLKWRGITAVCEVSDASHMTIKPGNTGFSPERPLFYP
ncbi:MAG: ComEC/Rec2 family competence protein, partial [Calditrichia bacterium]